MLSNLMQLSLDGGGSGNGSVWIESFLRWIHVVAGIFWIGLLYFFNFINGSFAAKLDAATKKIVVPQLMPRALFWFRWAALFTFVTGLGLFAVVYMMNKYFWVGLDSANGISGRGWWILVGVVFGTVMAYNVWMIIWPAQRKIIPAIRDGVAPDPALAKKATLASKVNTYLSVPLVASMLSQHFAAWIGEPMIYVPMVLAIGFTVVFLGYKFAPKVQGM